jgi:hypothetical protein
VKEIAIGLMTNMVYHESVFVTLIGKADPAWLITRYFTAKQIFKK